MATVRLVALDVDGTLLDRRQEISPNTRETIARLLAREIHIVLATGRLFINLRDLISQFGLTNPQITSGGSIVVMPQSGEVLYRAVIPRHMAEATLELADELGVTLLIARDNDLFARETNEDTAYLARFGGPAPTLVPDLHRVLEPAPTQLVAICTRRSPLADFYDCAVRLGLTRELAMCRGLPCVLDILCGEASKGHALRLVMERLGVRPDEAVAFGDGENDVSMFQVVGHSVAMGNASERVKRAATECTESCDYDGVSAAIRRWGL